MIEDQPPEGRAGRRCKQPSQVGQTPGADRHAPGVSLEPGEFVRGRARRSAALGGLETTDREDQAAGIGKGVLVGAVDFGAVLLAGNGVEALTADNPTHGFFFDFIGGYSFGGWAALARGPDFEQSQRHFSESC